MIYAGLDLEKRFSVITVTNTEGQELVKQRKSTHNGEIIELFQGLGEPVEVAIEATRSWYWLYALLAREWHKGEAFSPPLRPKRLPHLK